MTPKEKEVITQAFNMAFSIVAGDWRLPEPMNVAINRLQDAVFDLQPTVASRSRKAVQRNS